VAVRLLPAWRSTVLARILRPRRRAALPTFRSPAESARIIAERLHSLTDDADASGHHTLAYLLDLARQEAERCAEE
jgi:hypothetical protein